MDEKEIGDAETHIMFFAVFTAIAVSLCNRGMVHRDPDEELVPEQNLCITIMELCIAITSFKIYFNAVS